MSTSETDLEQELVNDIADFDSDPAGFVAYSYPWGEGELAQSSGARQWQTEILDCIGDHLRGESRFVPLRIAVSSGHGIGKSALVSWITDWALSTCEDCKIICTANTGAQLDTKTQPELAKWFRLSINSHWFEVNVTSIRVKDKAHQATWRADLIPWNERNPEAFAGAHNKGKRILVIFDEASAIPDIIWQTIEGALTDEDTEIIFLAFGNPTQNTGRFKECFGSLKHRWKTYQIDSRTVEGTNKQQIQEWIDDYGEDSDFVRVRVRGEFPRAGSTQFIPSDIVANARRYKADGFQHLPKIGSCDVARFGDDQTVIGDRQGRKARIIKRLRGQSLTQVALHCADYIDRERPDAFVIDGDGLGAGVFDDLKSRNYDRRTLLVEFHGGATATDQQKYFNKRAEVWGDMRDWLHNADIPDDPELDTDLTGVQYGFSNKGQIQLERKQDMKKRGLSSPDAGDMLAMTFGVKVAPKRPIQVNRPKTIQTPWS
jgi:hypothetical protein